MTYSINWKDNPPSTLLSEEEEQELRDLQEMTGL